MQFACIRISISPNPFGDAGYEGVEKRFENIGNLATWLVAMKRSKRKALHKNKLGRMIEKLEHCGHRELRKHATLNEAEQSHNTSWHCKVRGHVDW